MVFDHALVSFEGSAIDMSAVFDQGTSWKNFVDVYMITIRYQGVYINWTFCFLLVTHIPVETSGQDEPGRATRPPWIRPVRKKAPSRARSNQSGDSPSHHDSPEAFSPSDFFAEPSNSVFPATPSSTSGSMSSPPQYVNGSGTTQTQTNNSTYMDTSADMGMDMIRDDSQMYMFPGEMMALFNDGAVDVGQLLSSVEFMQQPTSPHHQNDRQGAGDGAPVTGFTSPGFLKMNGMVNS